MTVCTYSAMDEDIAEARRERAATIYARLNMLVGSETQLHLLRDAVDGSLTNRQIAQEFGCDPRTAQKRLATVLSRLRTAWLSQLAELAETMLQREHCVTLDPMTLSEAEINDNSYYPLRQERLSGLATRAQILPYLHRASDVLLGRHTRVFAATFDEASETTVVRVLVSSCAETAVVRHRLAA